MNIRKLFFSFLFLIASFILIDNVNAESTELKSERYYDIYHDTLNERLTLYDFEGFDSMFKSAYESYKNDYPYYLIVFRANYSSMIFVDIYLFDNLPTIKWKVYDSSNNLYVMLWNDEIGIGKFNFITDNDFDLYRNQSANYETLTFGSTIKNQSNMTYDNILFDNSFESSGNRYYEDWTYFVYDSNFDLYIEDSNALKSTRRNIDVKVGDYYYYANDVLPTYYDYLNPKPKTPTIDVEVTDKEKTTINNVDYVSKKNIKLNLNNFDFTKHQLYLAFDYPRGFCEYLPDFLTSSYSFDVTKNTNIYAKIVDRETFEELYTTSINITDISVPIPNIDVSIIETEYLNNDTSLPALSKTVQFNFDYFNTDIYSYKYYDLDYDTVVNILENNHIANTHTNGNFIIYVYDKQTNELVNSSTLTITGLFGSLFPQISIKHNSYDHKYCGDEKRVYSQTLDITFSILDSTRYIYEYSIDNVNYIEYDIKNNVAGYYFEYTIFKNSTLYVRIKDKNTNEILDYKEFIVDSITFDSEDITCILGTDFNSNLSALQEYLVELKETSNAFNQIFNSFYKSLPTVVSQGLAYAYIIILVIVGLKLGGWK